MFFQDIQVAQGILAVDVTLTIAQVPESLPLKNAHTLPCVNSNVVNLSHARCDYTVLLGTPSTFLIMLAPGDAPPPNPH